MFDHKGKHADKVAAEKVDKRGRVKRGVLGFTRFTFARPDTKEYRRFVTEPQHPTHIKEIHKYMALRIKHGTDNKHDVLITKGV